MHYFLSLSLLSLHISNLKRYDLTQATSKRRLPLSNLRGCACKYGSLCFLVWYTSAYQLFNVFFFFSFVCFIQKFVSSLTESLLPVAWHAAMPKCWHAPWPLIGQYTWVNNVLSRISETNHASRSTINKSYHITRHFCYFIQISYVTKIFHLVHIWFFIKDNANYIPNFHLFVSVFEESCTYTLWVLNSRPHPSSYL